MRLTKTKHILFFAFLSLSVMLNAQIDRSKMPEPGPAPKINLGEAQKFKLKNGLTVIMVENHKLPRAAATLTIDNPPRSEGEKAGLSSMMGSLLGRGTNNITKDEFNERVDFLGANVSFGSESAFASSLTKYFEEILGLMADGVKNSQFSQEEFDKEVKITLDGIKSSEKSVTAAAGRVQDVLTYGKDHPFGEFISNESVKNITLADVQNEYDTYYKPNNAYLIITGDINPKKTKKLVKKLFKDWEAGDIPAQTLKKVNNSEKTEIQFVDMPNAVQSEVAIINTVDLELGDKDYFAALLANSILGGGGTARLFMNLREDKGYTYGSYSSISQSRYVGRFRASASVRNMVTDSSVVQIMKEIKRIRNEQPTAEELENVKQEYIGNFVIGTQNPTRAAAFALNKELYDLPDDYYEKYLENINAVTLEDIQNAAKKYFKADNAKIFVTGKATDVLPNLEKAGYTINYYDKYGNATEKPEMKKPLPEGVTAETVMNKYLEAVGGKAKIDETKSILISYEASAMGSTIVSEEKRVDGKSSQSMSMNGNVMMNVVMTKEKVTMNKNPLPENVANDMKKLSGLFPELNIIDSGKAKLSGIEDVDGKAAYLVEIPGEVISLSYFYDVETGLKIKEIQTTSMQGRSQSQETILKDYKEFGGLKFPGVRSGKQMGQLIEFMLKEVKIDEGVSEEDFK